MNNYPESKVPIAPYLKKFLLNRYRLQEPVKIVENSPLGICIMKAILDQRSSRFKNKSTFEDYTDRLRIILSSDMIDRANHTERIIIFNIDFATLFRESLITWFEAKKSAGSTTTDAVKSFLNFYKIEEEEYSYDAAVRNCIRFQDRKQITGSEIRKAKRK